jgi:hypothetical protein
MRRLAFVCAVAAAGIGAWPARAADTNFPFDSELRLDVAPKRGSKRIPVLQVSPSGQIDIVLWCVSGKGTAVFAENTITIVPTSMQDNQCSPDQLAEDKSLLSDLAEVTSWRREGEVVTLGGPRTLRFRMSTN